MDLKICCKFQCFQFFASVKLMQIRWMNDLIISLHLIDLQFTWRMQACYCRDYCDILYFVC